MTNKLVSKTGWVFRGANGDEAIVYMDGADMPEDMYWAEIDALPQPAINIGAALWDSDGKKISLPFICPPSVLPDRTGVLVVFGDRRYSYLNPDGTDVFPKPNNAAIYNADGTLRFQLRFPKGDFSGRIGGIHSGTMPAPFNDLMGVVAGSAQGMPEWVYAVDPNSPELIPTGQWVRW